MGADDIIARPTQRVEDDDRGCFCIRVAYPLSDIAERLAKNLSALQQSGLRVSQLAGIADIAALAIEVVVHCLQRLLPEKVELLLWIRCVAQGVINGGELLPVDQDIRGFDHRRPDWNFPTVHICPGTCDLSPRNPGLLKIDR